MEKIKKTILIMCVKYIYIMIDQDNNTFTEKPGVHHRYKGNRSDKT